ncbi:13522_t:CDS:2 [Racocetra fulgida]|uniref:13521_t:CDS:1 n=1 Tax=Racocetra fulgida TaxID=60492 RepID=A0A9N8YXB4_9GLOM|nr:13521_t:CDS:2 [Racocetra fulgida]CAG8452442.1 13522_t:CDS:2 [Racocetra fulgida]
MMNEGEEELIHDGYNHDLGFTHLNHPFPGSNNYNENSPVPTNTTVVIQATIEIPQSNTTIKDDKPTYPKSHSLCSKLKKRKGICIRQNQENLDDNIDNIDNTDIGDIDNIDDGINDTGINKKNSSIIIDLVATVNTTIPPSEKTDPPKQKLKGLCGPGLWM